MSRISPKFVARGTGGTIDGQQIVTLLMIYYPSFAALQKGESRATPTAIRSAASMLSLSTRRKSQISWRNGSRFCLIPYSCSMKCKLPFRTTTQEDSEILRRCKYMTKGAMSAGTRSNRKTPTKSQFFGKAMKYSYPVGWLYPVFAAFRILAGPDKSGGGVWKREPIEFWRKHAQEIFDATSRTSWRRATNRRGWRPTAHIPGGASDNNRPVQGRTAQRSWHNCLGEPRRAISLSWTIFDLARFPPPRTHGKSRG